MNKTFIFTFISLLVVLADQYTKYLVRHKLIEGRSVKFIGKVVYLTYLKNRGAAFSILQGGRWIFVVIAIAAAALIIANIRLVVSDGLLSVGTALLLGGIVGNLIDRFFLGFVTDFIDFRFWPVFNIADSAVDIGLLIIFIYFLFYGNGKNFKSHL